MSNVLQDITALLPATAVQGIERRRKQEHFHVRTADLRLCPLMQKSQRLCPLIIMIFSPCFLTFHVFLLVSSLKESSLKELERRQSREKKQDTADFSCIDKLKDDEPPKCCTCPTTVVLLCPPIRLQEEERRAPVFMCRHVKTSEASMFLFLVWFLFKCTC